MGQGVETVFSFTGSVALMDNGTSAELISSQAARPPSHPPVTLPAARVSVARAPRARRLVRRARAPAREPDEHHRVAPEVANALATFKSWPRQPCFGELAWLG